MTDLAAIRRRVDAKLADYRVARAAVRAERRTLRELTERQESLKQAQQIAQAVAQRVQERAYRKIADVVSRSLSAVFEEPYAFKLSFEQKRGKTEASLTFERDGAEIDPMTAAGGGVVDVAAFALRLSCLLLSSPKRRKTLVLDEPFKWLSAEYRDRVAALLKELSRELGVQFIIVTHMRELEIGTVVRL